MTPNAYKVYYRRRNGMRRMLRRGIHVNLQNFSEHEFRLMLLKEYNRTNKKVEKIEFSMEKQ